MARVHQWIPWAEAARLAGFDVRAQRDPGRACRRRVSRYNRENPGGQQILIHPDGGAVDRETFLAAFEARVEQANPGYAGQLREKQRLLAGGARRSGVRA